MTAKEKRKKSKPPTNPRHAGFGNSSNESFSNFALWEMLTFLLLLRVKGASPDLQITER